MKYNWHSLVMVAGLALPPTTAFGSMSGSSRLTTSAAKRPFLTRMFSSSSMSDESKKDQTFNTWSYNGPCTTMEWTSLLNVDLSMAEAPASSSSALEADLIVVGVHSPAKEDEEEEEDKDKEEDDKDDEDDDDKEEETVALSGLAKDLEEALGGDGVLSSLIAENNKAFHNGRKAGSTTPVARVVVAGQAKRVVFLGLGPVDEQKDDEKRSNLGKAIGKALASQCSGQKKVTSCAVVLPAGMAAEALVMQDMASSFYQNLYADNRYKSKPKKVAEDLTSVQVWIDDNGDSSVDRDAASAALVAGQQLAAGIVLTKDIVNAPHNVLNSLSLADTAKRIADGSTNGCVTCEILDTDECEKRGMGAFLGVARGSETEPQFIHLTYKPPGEIKKKVGVIGKGLLFDTGGYNIKTQMMSLMKFDCGGAAAVLGAARAVAAMQPEGVEVHFIVAACENMINSKAMVPSDILTASNGKTIEVLNTDAEGRLTLADALVFADKEVEAESIIELSTLTGACMISLGKQIAGVWTSNDDLASELADVSKATGDKSWRMPLANEYMEELTSSNFADLKNIGGKYGGAITAALFLQHFVRKKTPFAHIDIAGPVWNEKTGATGYGAQLVVEWVRRQGL